MKTATPHPDLHPGISRLSISLPSVLAGQLDDMVATRGFSSRSQAVSDMVSAALAAHQAREGNQVMAGTILLHYDRTVRGLQKALADIQQRHVNEVISSLHVQLSNAQVMEVIIVQGCADRLHEIADELLTRRGVITGQLRLLAAIIPPIQQGST